MTDVSKELLPCPFCGCADVRVLPRLRKVFCMAPECDAAMDGTTQDAAIARWNTRAEPTTDVVERAFVAGFLAHMKNPRADPYNEWEVSEVRAELRSQSRDSSAD